MSDYGIGMVMNRLLNDEDLRVRFAIDRMEVLGELHAHGLELTQYEIDLFIESDLQLWAWTDRSVAAKTH